MLGDDIMAAPVVTPVNTTTSLADKDVWLPPGTWIDTSSCLTYYSDGSVILHKYYDLSEVPLFVKAGAVIPTRPLSSLNR